MSSEYLQTKVGKHKKCGARNRLTFVIRRGKGDRDMDKNFWKATGVRAFRTFLQVILAVWTAGTMITEVPWKVVLLSAFSAAVYSVLTSILTGLPEVDYAQHIYMSAEEPEDSWIEEAEEEAGDSDEE